MMIVIGSGPSAIAAAHALVQQGHRVTLLDVGNRLEATRQSALDRLAGREPGAWAEKDVEVIVGSRGASDEAVHSKLSYGSSYSFSNHASPVGVRWREGTGFHHSLARGGLSNVWGSALLPYRQADIADWPITVKDLEPHYQAVMRFVPGTGIKDDLEEILPSYSERSQELEPSRQGRALLDDLEKHARGLRKGRIWFGRSRLAIQTSGDELRHGCVRCALCLSGCPYGLIYSSAHTLDDLLRENKLEYRPGHFVEKLEATGEGVVVHGRDLGTGADFAYRAARVFVGAGVLPTARIVLSTLGAFDTPVSLKDSQYFIYPLLRWKAVDGVENEATHTASQVFMEIDDEGVSDYLVHLQIYGYSAFLHQELNRTFLRWPLKSAAFRRFFLGRLMVVQGFVHSKESGSIELELKRAADHSVQLQATKRPAAIALATVLKVGWKLMRQSLRLRAVPLLPGLQYPSPGSGYHSGGTFPMRHEPGRLETDSLGRLPGLGRVHLVDSSVLPSIPATSITFSVMANAHRIATSAGQLDPV